VYSSWLQEIPVKKIINIGNHDPEMLDRFQHFVEIVKEDANTCVISNIPADCWEIPGIINNSFFFDNTMIFPYRTPFLHRTSGRSSLQGTTPEILESLRKLASLNLSNRQLPNRLILNGKINPIVLITGENFRKDLECLADGNSKGLLNLVWASHASPTETLTFFFLCTKLFPIKEAILKRLLITMQNGHDHEVLTLSTKASLFYDRAHAKDIVCSSLSEGICGECMHVVCLPCYNTRSVQTQVQEHAFDGRLEDVALFEPQVFLNHGSNPEKLLCAIQTIQHFLQGSPLKKYIAEYDSNRILEKAYNWLSVSSVD
jgi:hypothetical protein